MISKLRKKLIILFLIFTMSAFSVVLTLMGIYTVSRVRNSQTQYVNNLADSLLEQLQAGSSLDELIDFPSARNNTPARAGSD